MEKNRKALILFGVLLALLAVVCVAVGFVLFFAKYHWLKLMCGILLVLLGILFALLSIYFIYIGASKKINNYVSTSLNAKSNVKRCSKCGNVLEQGASVCDRCGQTASSCKVCECGAENNIENKKCTSCGKKLD